MSLVATLDGQVVGHIAFSPVTVSPVAVSNEDHGVLGVGLAPMAVLPKLQRQGIGGTLIAEGLRRLRERDVPFCVVLGHSGYYPRFGFERASSHGIRWEHDAPDDVFFVQSLQPDGLKGCVVLSTIDLNSMACRASAAPNKLKYSYHLLRDFSLTRANRPHSQLYLNYICSAQGHGPGG